MRFEETMAEVLKQGKYARLTGRYFDWRAWLKERILEFIQWLLDRININQPELGPVGSELITTIFIIVSALLVAIVISLAIFLIRRYGLKHQSLTVLVYADISLQNATPESLLAAGSNFASLGNTREAVRYCFAALLLALHEKKIINVGKSKTNTQILRELKQYAPAFVSGYKPLMLTFNDAWFGHKLISPENFEKYSSQTKTLIEEAKH
jgi:hypothetical protein